MSPDSSRALLQKSIPWLLFGFFFSFYLIFHQANPPYDSGAFVAWWRDGVVEWLHPHHPLFAYGMAWTLAAGRAAGLSAMGAGLVHVAFFTAFSLALFYMFLRRCGVGTTISACFAAMLGLNSTVLINATSVELYASSLFAIMLSLHAFLSVARKKTTLNLAVLWLLCLVVVSLHAGYAMWVLAIYLTLAWRDRRDLSKGFVWLAQGAAAGVVFIGWLYLADVLSAKALVDTKSFYEQFWMRPEDGGVLWRCVRAPLYDFSSFAGLILFPAMAGLAAFRKTQYDMARFFVISTIGFFSFYTFWVPDHGSFYLPLQPVWGLFAALALERFLKQTNKKGLALLLLGMAVYAILFVWLPFERSHKPNGLSELATWVLGVSFLPVLALSWLGGIRLRRAVEPETPGRGNALIYAGSVLLASCLIYLPGVFLLLKPNADTLLLWSFRDLDTPSGARLVTRLTDFRPEAVTERECLTAPNIFASPPSPDDYEHFNKQFNRWLDESGHPDTPLYFDDTCHLYRDWLWAINLVWTRDNGKDLLPHEQFDFTPVESGDFVFYRAAPKPARLEEQESSNSL